jgi:hypothetical protein
MGFTKLDSGIIHSSIWSECVTTRIVWITMLAMADANGFVSCSFPGLVRAANVTKEEAEKALDSFLEVDKYSRTSEHEGRRIENTEGGWIILNYKKYREYSKTDYLREKQAKYREKKECIDTVSIPSASASASSSFLKEKVILVIKPAWRESLEVYLEEERKGFAELLRDSEWISQQERLKKFPNLNIKKTLEKSRIFWASEAGWKHKKSKRTSEKINWKSLYTNALTMGTNQVFDKKDSMQTTRTMEDIYGNN